MQIMLQNSTKALITAIFLMTLSATVYIISGNQHIAFASKAGFTPSDENPNQIDPTIPIGLIDPEQLLSRMHQSLFALGSEEEQIKVGIVDLHSGDVSIYDYVIGGSNAQVEQAFINSAEPIKVAKSSDSSSISSGSESELSSRDGFSIPPSIYMGIIEYPFPSPQDIVQSLDSAAEADELIHVVLVDGDTADVQVVEYIVGEKNTQAINEFEQLHDKSKQIELDSQTESRGAGSDNLNEIPDIPECDPHVRPCKGPGEPLNLLS